MAADKRRKRAKSVSSGSDGLESILDFDDPDTDELPAGQRAVVMFSSPSSHPVKGDELSGYLSLPSRQSVAKSLQLNMNDSGILKKSEFKLEAMNYTVKSPLQQTFFTNISIPRSPKSVLSHSCQFFQNFDRECITSAHYFAWHDSNQFYTKLLPAMAEEHLALRYSRLAFSALIYSTKAQERAKEIALLYYAATLRELRLFLSKPLNQIECNVAVAISLQLASFDVNPHSDYVDGSFFSGITGIFFDTSKELYEY
jgi:hypothetical protein